MSSAFLPQENSSWGENKISNGALFRESDDDNEFYRPHGLESRLTVSFPRDGASLFAYKNSLSQTFSGMLTQVQMENTILAAFQTWAREGNLDVGIVPDSGDEFGVHGRTFGDSRFGDVRVGAFPMGNDVFAVALNQQDFVSGTWSGDILFNSEGLISDPNHFFAVALHEAGHVLGLNHSTDPGSVMHVDSMNTSLSADDIAAFQAMYGVRNLDPNEYDEHNNNMSEASRVKLMITTGPKVSTLRYCLVIFRTVQMLTILKRIFPMAIPVI